MGCLINSVRELHGGDPFAMKIYGQPYPKGHHPVIEVARGYTLPCHIYNIALSPMEVQPRTLSGGKWCLGFVCHF